MGKKRDKEEGKKKGRISCCEREGMRKGAWTASEDKILVDFITENGHGIWRNLPKLAGLLRCGKSCRLRWTNYLRPDIKRGPFGTDEENTIIRLHRTLGNKWAAIASHLPGRTDNDIKNFWNSSLRKRFSSKVLDLDQPSFSSKSVDMKSDSPITRHMIQWESVRLEAESRLSSKPLPLNNAPSGSKSEDGYFPHMWNSDVGQSFQNVNEECEGAASHSPTTRTSLLIKVESGSRTTSLTEPYMNTRSPEMADQKVAVWKCKKEAVDVAAYSDSSKSYEMDDSSDAMMKLLLDFPVGGNDMGFLQGSIDDVSTYIQD